MSPTSLLALLTLLCPATLATSQEGHPLSVGDPAPKLAVERWIRGEPLKAFEPGKLYVVEFWSTASGPSVAGIPHLSALQREYASQGLRVVSVSSAAADNSLQEVEALVKAKGEILAYDVAWDQGRNSRSAWMDAAGRGGLPCAFVIDRQGRIAYIGHPMFLDEPVGQLVAGEWDLASDPAALEAAQREYFGYFALGRGDPAGTLEKLPDFEKRHPRLQGLVDSLRFDLALQAHDLDLVEATARGMLERAGAARDPVTLGTLAGRLIDPDSGVETRHLDLALRAAERAVELTSSTDPDLLATLAAVHAARGDLAKAVGFQTQAVQIASDREKARLMRTLQDYQLRAAR